MSKYLGIEFGSTRIKALLIDEKHNPIDSGDYTWKARFENGVWTYDLPEAIKGLKAALHGIDNLDDISAMGVSGMMHGHLAFDSEWNLLVPFRTWQCTITADAAKELTDLFGFNIPQRWSIAHLYQAILNKEEHVGKIAHITTLAGYMHYLLTGKNVVGVGEASGIFPIDSNTCDYDKAMQVINDLSKEYEKCLSKIKSLGVYDDETEFIFTKASLARGIEMYRAGCLESARSYFQNVLSHAGESLYSSSELENTAVQYLEAISWIYSNGETKIEVFIIYNDI